MLSITGLITSDGSGVSRWDTMLKDMHPETFCASGTYVSADLGLAVGWMCGSTGDVPPVWNEQKNICLILCGEGLSERCGVQIVEQGEQRSATRFSALMQSYERDGLAFLEHLNGWFSGVLIDLRDPQVVLFNDRYGLQRVYYHEHEAFFYFSSEAKALLGALPHLRRLDPKALAEYCSCGCPLDNKTLFANVSLLPGASCWTFRRGQRPRKATYFRKETWESQSPLDSEQFYAALKETFRHVLPRYLSNPDRLGMSLTGGLDGRMIMAWAGLPHGALPCYTFGSTYRECADVRIARQVAKACGQKHHVIPLDGAFLADFPKLAEQAIYISDGAMNVTGSVELYANRMARQIAPIRLTGNYGSEILRGNVAFKPQALNEHVYNSEFVRLGCVASEKYALESRVDPLSFIAFKQVPWHHYSRLSLEQSQLRVRTPYLDNDLVRLMYQAPHGLIRSKNPSLRLINEGSPVLSRIPTDRGLVYRPAPILGRLSHLYQEFTFRTEYAWDYGMPQWLARLDGHVAFLHPEQLFLGRHKFYHFRVWYRDQLASYLKDMLLDPNARSRQYLREGSLEHLVRSHLEGRGNFTEEIHQILTLELIHRRLLDIS
jgi:asparagine synthase (glutamine-hydrolysing)